VVIGALTVEGAARKRRVRARGLSCGTNAAAAGRSDGLLHTRATRAKRLFSELCFFARGGTSPSVGSCSRGGSYTSLHPVRGDPHSGRRGAARDCPRVRGTGTLIHAAAGRRGARVRELLRAALIPERERFALGRTKPGPRLGPSVACAIQNICPRGPSGTGRDGPGVSLAPRRHLLRIPDARSTALGTALRTCAARRCPQHGDGTANLGGKSDDLLWRLTTNGMGRAAYQLSIRP
jgi:hypothetical protein